MRQNISSQPATAGRQSNTISKRLSSSWRLALLEAESEQLSHEGLLDTLGNWIELIPADQRAARPRLLLDLARAYQTWGRNDEAIGVAEPGDFDLQRSGRISDGGASPHAPQRLAAIQGSAPHGDQGWQEGAGSCAGAWHHGRPRESPSPPGERLRSTGEVFECRETVQGGLEGFSGRGKPFSAISDPTAASALSTVSSGTQRSRLRISSWPGKGGRR